MPDDYLFYFFPLLFINTTHSKPSYDSCVYEIRVCICTPPKWISRTALISNAFISLIFYNFFDNLTQFSVKSFIVWYRSLWFFTFNQSVGMRISKLDRFRWKYLLFFYLHIDFFVDVKIKVNEKLCVELCVFEFYVLLFCDIFLSDSDSLWPAEKKIICIKNWKLMHFLQFTLNKWVGYPHKKITVFNIIVSHYHLENSTKFGVQMGGNIY